jgi:hypothetical protein
VSPPAALLVCTAIAAVVAFDAWQRRELLLLANLGTRAPAHVRARRCVRVLFELTTAAAGSVLGAVPRDESPRARRRRARGTARA